ncbi:MAG: hypothetical protein Q7S00_00780 [bacterium]|nr:hypothetical protein [bacterium]
MKTRPLFFLLLSLTFASCGGTAATTTNNNNNNQEDDTTITSGSIGFFSSKSSESSDSMTVSNSDGSSTVTITEGSSYVYRYVPADAVLDQLSDTYAAYNNFSCQVFSGQSGTSANQFPYTVDQNLYQEMTPFIGLSLTWVRSLSFATRLPETQRPRFLQRPCPPIAIAGLSLMKAAARS